MPEGPGAKDAATRSLTRSALQAKTCLVWGAGMSRSPGPGRREPDPGAAVSVRAANPALDPRDRKVIMLRVAVPVSRPGHSLGHSPAITRQVRSTFSRRPR
jgi:hypothetical protein